MIIVSEFKMVKLIELQRLINSHKSSVVYKFEGMSIDCSHDNTLIIPKKCKIHLDSVTFNSDLDIE